MSPLDIWQKNLVKITTDISSVSTFNTYRLNIEKNEREEDSVSLTRWQNKRWDMILRKLQEELKKIENIKETVIRMSEISKFEKELPMRQRNTKTNW